MKLKTYRAVSMADALSAVKKDLGKSAVILHTRTIRVGGILGFGRKTVVEVTASDQPPGGAGLGGGRTSAAGSGGDGRAVERQRSMSAYTNGVMRDSGRNDALSSQSEINRPASDVFIRGGGPASPVVAVEPIAQIAVREARSQVPHERATADVNGGGVIAAAPTTPVALSARTIATAPANAAEAVVMPVRERRSNSCGESSPSNPASAMIHRELADIKLLVSQVLASSPPSDPGLTGFAGCIGGAPDPLFRHYLKLLESQVSREIADRVIARVRDDLDAVELTDEASVRACVLRHLSSLIPVAEAVPLPMRGGPRAVGTSGSRGPGGPFVVALVGPTGVGKTTTIAKLAATYRLRHGRSVAMITADTYRIAAVDQLRTYASIIGLPLKVVLTPAEMAAAVEAFSSHDVVLIDTAGRSQRNTERLTELSAFLEAAKPDETHLVLSSAAAQEVLLKAAEAFRVLAPNRVILTKLDEAVNFGVVVNVMQRLRSKLSFVTMGQEVPDHIEPGRPDRLAKLILGSEPLGAGGFADACSWSRPGGVEVMP